MRQTRRTVLGGLAAASASAVSALAPDWAAAGAPGAGLALTRTPSDLWTKEPGARITSGGRYRSRLVAHPSNVLRFPDGLLRLYYYGADDDLGYILSATSRDWGASWATEAGYHLVSRPDEAWVSDPFVLPLPGGGYRLYYKAYRPGWRGCLFSARSVDGLEWQREGIRLMPGPPGSPDSARTCFPWLVPGRDEALRLYYGGSEDAEPFGVFRILSGTSRDGLDWSKEPGLRVDRGGRDTPDQGGVLMPAVYHLPDGRLRMYYIGGNGDVGWRAILAAVSADGLVWHKEAGVRLAPSPGGLDAAGVVKPSFIQLPDGRVRMLYVGMDGSTARILSAVAYGRSE